MRIAVAVAAVGSVVGRVTTCSSSAIDYFYLFRVEHQLLLLVSQLDFMTESLQIKYY